MATLRRLLLRFAASVKGISPSHYTLLEALVDEINELKAQVEVVEPEDINAIIRKLCENGERWQGVSERWERRCRKAEEELAEAKAERDSWERQCRNAERGLAKAKFTIEERGANAEIGRLVRGMRDSTYLERDCEGYRANWWYRGVGWHKAALIIDPAEALRAIQKEESDD